MHYYKRNLGDYAKKAGRLSMLQHGSYTLLIDSCYDREQFPTLEQAIEWTWASSTEEIEAVKFVLSKFFTLDSDGTYVQERILQELLEYQAKADTNKRIAIERETNRKKTSTNRAQVVNESPPNQEPRTINQEPITNKEKKPQAAIADALKFDFRKSLIDLGVEEQNAQAWMQVRKLKKAANTDIALQALIREAYQAGLPLNDAVKLCAENSWQGFQAKYVQNNVISKKHEKFDPTAYVNRPRNIGGFLNE